MADTVITGPVNPQTATPETGATVEEPGGDDDVILRMDAVVGGYGATTVLHETSLEVRRNALTTIIGPNGAGKSTAIKAIFGMVRVRSGHVWYEDEDIVGLSQVELLRRGISFVPQGRNVFPRMSVRANLELGGVSLDNLALTRERVSSIAFELFPMLRVKADKQASTLSGGEQKMLEIGRAMLLEPRLLLIDEPSVGLSPILVQQVFALLQGLRDRGTTVLMIEQNAKSALEVSDYGLVLQQGRLALAGTAPEILNHPEIGRLFLGGAMRGVGSVRGEPARNGPDVS
ncbi:MAG TPA: ABC transporter ATP-binding protein [Ilumatobacteraceae bacterium]|nr:ABC transporter ATP-binding protein [Ilumatobacteraceae bacterium]